MALGGAPVARLCKEELSITIFLLRTLLVSLRSV